MRPISEDDVVCVNGKDSEGQCGERCTQIHHDREDDRTTRPTMMEALRMNRCFRR